MKKHKVEDRDILSDRYEMEVVEVSELKFILENLDRVKMAADIELRPESTESMIKGIDYLAKYLLSEL